MIDVSQLNLIRNKAMETYNIGRLHSKLKIFDLWNSLWEISAPATMRIKLLIEGILHHLQGFQSHLYGKSFTLRVWDELEEHLWKAAIQTTQ